MFHSIAVALNHQNIENHPERISNIMPFINQYNWGFSSRNKTGKGLNEIIRQLPLVSYT